MKRQDNKYKDENEILQAPLNYRISPQQRKKSALQLSDLATSIATYVICHTIVDHEELLSDERMSVAHSILQRVTTTHMCNHKLTAEGIALSYNGQSFQLHDEYKTMTLTRTVYEHLAMFYFLFEHPHGDEEKALVWNYWKLNSKKDLQLQRGASTEQSISELENLRNEILSSPLGRQHQGKLADWTNPDTVPHNGTIEFFRNKNQTDVRKVSYSQAWKYLYKTDDMASVYRHLSMHCHPVYNGLVLYHNQSATDNGDDCIPLYLSSSFLAYLCRLYLRVIPQGSSMLNEAFTPKQLFIFKALAQLSEQHTQKTEKNRENLPTSPY